MQFGFLIYLAFYLSPHSRAYTLCYSVAKSVWLCDIRLSCPSLSLLCHPFLLPSIFPSISGSFPMSPLLHQVAKVLELQLQHQSFQWIFRVDFLQDWLVWSCSPRDSQESSPALPFKSINSLALSLLYGLTLTFVHDYWKNHSFDWTDLCLQSNAFSF